MMIMRISLLLSTLLCLHPVQAWLPPARRSATVQCGVSAPDTLDDEQAFLEKCRILCEERNLPLEKVKNCRDLASVRKSPIQPNRIYRLGRLSDATDADIDLLLRGKVNLTTIVDLRSPTELKDDPTLFRPAVFGNFTTLVWKEQGRGKPGCVKELPPGESPVMKKRRFRKKKDNGDEILHEEEAAISHDDDDEASSSSSEESLPNELLSEEFCVPCAQDKPVPHRKERHFVSMMNEWKYVKGTASKLRKRDITKALMKSPGALVSRRVRSSIKKPFLDEINDGGLPMLNELLLRFGAPGIRYVLELCADRTRHPIGFHCTAGKDRTGLIAALVLALCGVEPEDIVEDYTLSANVYAEMNDHKAMVGALSQRNLDPKTFLGAPPHVMREILQSIEEDYGSVQEYCNWIGFGPEMQAKLVEACTQP